MEKLSIFYSASRAGFYPASVMDENGPYGSTDLPSDLIAISQARYDELMKGQSEGRAIIASKSGRPTLAPKPVAALRELRAQILSRVKREAFKRIDQIAPQWRQLNALREGGESLQLLGSRIDAVRAASDMIEDSIKGLDRAELERFDVANHPFWPEF